MRRNPRDAVLETSLQEAVLFLNDDDGSKHPLHNEARTNFIQLIQAWKKAQAAPPNAFEQEHRKPLPVLLKMKLPAGCPNWREIEKHCKAHLPPAGTGARPHVHYVGQTPWTAWDAAINLFVQLLINSARDKLAGPCERCGKYYVKKRVSQKVYCSRMCGNAATAIIRTRKKWDQERAVKLECARIAAKKWARSKSSKPWKKYVCSEYPDLTPKFLTRAINQSELSEPTKGIES